MWLAAKRSKLENVRKHSMPAHLHQRHVCPKGIHFGAHSLCSCCQ